jgi:flagellar biosynthesis protein FlhG
VRISQIPADRGHNAPVKVIAVTGGKGGVGKTSIAVNLATALAARKRRVVVLDGDLGLANVEVLLGLTPSFNLAHVLDGTRELSEIMVRAEQGFSIVPASSGVARLANLSDAEHLGLVRAFSTLTGFDTLIVDTPAGISSAVTQLSQASQHVLVVVTDEPASLTDSYALIKVLSRHHGVREFKVVANRAQAGEAGRSVFAQLELVTRRFLDVTLEFAGEIPEDQAMRRSVREQRPVIAAYPLSACSLALKKLSEQADNWPVPAGARGNIEFFAERLVRRAATRLELVS